MVGWDKNTAINAYNPSWGMWIAITRKTAQAGVICNWKSCLTREEALTLYSGVGCLSTARRKRSRIR